MADDADQLGQDEIEALLRQAETGGGAAEKPADSAPASEPAAPPAASTPASPSSAGSAISQNDIELLLDKAEQALESVNQSDSQTVLPPGIRSFEFEKFGGTAANTESATLELMRDVQLDMTIELGRTHMQLEELLKLKQGAVVPLDKLAGDPADIYVNGRLVARGEVLVLNDNFCIRVAELIEGENAVA